MLGFSDLQADIAAELIRRGIEVHVFNQRSVAEILRMIRTLGGMIGCEAKAAALAERLEAGSTTIAAAAAQLPRRPRVYFEEWDEPQISGIRWVSELIGIAGGDDVFRSCAQQSLGRDRIIADPQEVPRRAPDLIFGSWCGKKFNPRRSRRVPAGARSRPCATASCTRSSRRSSCSPARGAHRRRARAAARDRGMGRQALGR